MHSNLSIQGWFFSVSVIFMILSHQVVRAQLPQSSQNPFKVNQIPPSPEAAALAKYAEVPVSLYSGTPRIGIPLYMVKERDLSLPISVNYHASGHKVSAEASYVGLGWSLDAGGVVTRSVRGWPDEFTEHGFLHQIQLHEVEDFALGIHPPEQQVPWYDAMARNCKDIEPDFFYFNFAGISGKFMFNWDGEIEIASEHNLKITPLGINPGTSDFIDGFEIVAPDGTVYVFNVIETVDQASGGPQLGCDLPLQDPIVSSWYLREIRTPNFLTWIRFEYEPYTQVTETWSMETQIHNVALSPSTPSKQISIVTVNGKQLKTITTSSGQTRIDFVKGLPRTDVGENCFSLGQIIVKNSRNRVVKDWRFGYDYSTGRLSLKTITEWAGNSSLPPYEFKYLGGIPAVNSSSQDHWGFANSNSSNGTMIRAVTAKSAFSSTPVNLPGADRSPDPARVTAGMLYEIVYPTGGKDLLEFESHDYSFMQGNELDQDITIQEGSGSAFAPRDFVPVGTMDVNQIDFTLNDAVKVYVTGNATFGYHGPGGATVAPVSLTLKNKITGQVLFTRAPGGTPQQLPTGEWESTSVLITDSLSLTPGTYSIIATGKKINAANGMNSITGGVHWYKIVGQTTSIQKGGGVRIKKITRSFGNGNPDKVQRYIYKIVEDGRVKSSGSLLESAFKYEDWILYKENEFQVPESKFFRFSVNRGALGATQGSHVGYEYVEVLDGENGENGKTTYRYNSPRYEQDYSSLQIPYAPPSSFDHRRGLLLQQDVYDSAELLVKTITNEYTYYHKRNYGVKVGFLIPGEGPWYAERYAVDAYENILGYSRLKLTTEKNFSYLPGNQYSSFFTLEKSQRFKYNEDTDHRQLIETVTKNSAGDSVFTAHIYPQDYPNGNSSIDLMKTQHVVNQPVEVVVFEKSQGQTYLLSGIKTGFTTHLGEAVPASVSGASIYEPIPTNFPRAEVQGRYEQRLLYISYDSYGNLTDHASKDGVRTCYSWGENGTLLFAKADHAQSNQIFFTSFEDDIQASLAQHKTGRKSKAFNNAPYSIPSAKLPAVAGDYILTYWIFSDSSWNYHEKIVQGYQPGNTILTETITGYLDEVRLYPKGSGMTTYTYEPLVGITSTTDINNITIYFEYDEFNRLKCKRDQDNNILEKYDYRYMELIPYAVENSSVQH